MLQTLCKANKVARIFVALKSKDKLFKEVSIILCVQHICNSLEILSLIRKIGFVMCF
jgi:hypothetical protein